MGEKSWGPCGETFTLYSTILVLNRLYRLETSLCTKACIIKTEQYVVVVLIYHKYMYAVINKQSACSRHAVNMVSFDAIIAATYS